MNYGEAVEFINSLQTRGSIPGLCRIKKLLSLLGDPQDSFKVIHVTGTNGKGSFCAMLESVLRVQGYRTGLFTSPAIENFEERIRLCGKDIDSRSIAETVTDISGLFSHFGDDTPTEFEFVTALGFEYFKRNNVDIAIVECGMGGREDATNVFSEVLLSVITGVSLDHTSFLGDSVSEIAYQKAGIIKKGCPVLYCGNDPEAEAVIVSEAKRVSSRLYKKSQHSHEIKELTLNGTVLAVPEFGDIYIPLLGIYQPQNAMSVIDACSVLRENGICIKNESIKKGLASVKWCGRFERLCETPTVIFDGGHNLEGVRAAVQTLKLYFEGKKTIIISGVMADKDYLGMADEISSVASTVYTVRPSNPRALDPEKYAGEYRIRGVAAHSCDSFDKALCLAFAESKGNSLPIICIGSLYSYGSFKNALTALLRKEKQN